MTASSVMLSRLLDRAWRSAAFAAWLAMVLLRPEGLLAATLYTYDELNRLTQVVYDDGRRIEYRYDAAGNLLQVTKTGVDITPNLVAWWNFDDCTATDRSGLGHHGTVGPGVVCEPGRAGQAMRFAGGTITVPAYAALRLDGQVTLSAVVWLDAASVDAAGILQKGASGNNWDYGLATYGHAPAYRSTNSDWRPNAGGPVPDNAGAWHLFTAVVDEADGVQPIRLFVDGVLMPGLVRSLFNGDPAVEPWRSALLSPSSLGLTMGIGLPGKPLLGALDEVRIYDKAMSAAQVANLARSLGFMP